MNKYLLALAATLFAMGCDTVGDTGTKDNGGGGGGTDDAPASAAVSWGSSSLTLTIDGGPGGYWFGMAETSGSCGDYCWTGEDCYVGYTSPDSGASFSYCHDAGDGGTTTLSYGGDPENLNEGYETVFTDALSGDTTYFLESDSDWGGNGLCWVWGNDSNYYDALGCDYPAW